MAVSIFVKSARRTCALVFVLAGCASGTRVTHENLNGVLWIQTSAEYYAACTNTYAAARGQLDRALADPAWTAPLEQTGGAATLPPAVVLDVDETVLDNSAFQANLTATNGNWSREAWNAWCREERAGVVPGAVDFCNYAVEKGVTLLFITNRDAQVAEATMHNFAKVGLPFDPARVQVIGKTAESDKAARRKALCEKYRIVLLVGDQLGDFLSVPKETPAADRILLAKREAERWGRQWIALPNPTYGDWEHILTDSKASDEEKLKEKFGLLKR